MSCNIRNIASEVFCSIIRNLRGHISLFRHYIMPSFTAFSVTWLNRFLNPRWLWPLLITLNFLLHVPAFPLPPTSIHLWRQSNTMAVARNFYEEDMNILRPRVDRRNDSSGVTGMQFPSYEWTVALAYKLLGFHESIPRVLNWLLFLLGCWGFYRLVELLSGSAALAAAGAWMYSWSPELFYQAANALPDVLALSASVWGLYFFLRWYQRPQALHFVLALLATTLGGLTKLQYLVVGVPIAAIVLTDAVRGRLPWRRLGWLVGFASISVGVTLAWYAYALRLIASSGLADYGLEVRSAASWHTALAILQDNVVSDVPELLLNFATFGLVLLGTWRLWQERRWRHPWFGALLAWALALLVYHLLELAQMDHHHYYMLPYVPVLLLVALVGVAWLRRQSRAAASAVLLLLLVAQPVLAFIRIVPPRWLHPERGLPAEFGNAVYRQQLRAATPDSALCVVGPDESGCINFYFLHKKGFGFNQSDHLLRPAANGQHYLATCISRGARYLYTTDTAVVRHPQVRPYLGQQLRQVGSMGVWRLHPKAE